MIDMNLPTTHQLLLLLPLLLEPVVEENHGLTTIHGMATTVLALTVTKVLNDDVFATSTHKSAKYISCWDLCFTTIRCFFNFLLGFVFYDNCS